MASNDTGAPRRGLSLQYKLPLLIMGLLLALVVAGSVLAYREVRRSAILAASDHLQNATRQLADIARQSIKGRLALLGDIADDARIRSFLSAPAAADTGEVREAFQRLGARDDSAELPLELVAPDRRVLFRTGEFPRDWRPEQVATQQEQLPLADSAVYGPVHVAGPGAYLWITAPVRFGGRLLGYVAHLRRLGSPVATQDMINRLIGIPGSVYYAGMPGGSWVTLTGRLVPSPIARPVSHLMTYTRPGRGVFLADGAVVEGTQIAIVVESPMRTVLARPAAFLRHLLMGAVLLVLVGAIAAWLLSRRITRPLKELATASRAIAAGDYSRRVDFDRGDEIGALARAFSRMAGEVQSAHDAMRHQYEGARALADQLEAANEQLTAAMVAAEHARADAETASRAKSEFLATMSHEIRTPINAIVGYTDLLCLGLSGPVNETQRDQLDRIRASGRHLIGLVDEVLDLARIESGRLQVEAGVGCAGDAVRAALAVVAPQAARKGVELSEACAGECDAHYTGDPRRVEQILINLLSNAVKFTGASGRVELNVSTITDDDSLGWACITVHDTGIGIAPDQLDEIFKPFVQADRGYTRAHGGVGLGLAISRRLARMMGGDITVESVPGNGSTFTLRLPLGPHTGADSDAPHAAAAAD